MKFKYSFPLLMAGAALSIAAAASGGLTDVSRQNEPSVQGIPYLSTLPDSGPHSRQKVLARDFIMPDEGTELGGIGDFSLDSIKNWSGEGSKRAGLIIQWNTGRDKVALAFGYRFDGSPTGIDMLRCVVENNPQLYGLFQRTNVSSGNEKYGYTINGIGWDANCSGLPVSIIDTGNGNEVYTSYTGFFDHPRGCSESVSYPDYDYDNWRAADEGDLWQAGWYQGYWSYWLKDGDSNFSYSGVGASGRTLSDGSWDGWNYQPDMQMYDWMPIVAVPSLVPEGYTEVFISGGITYKLKDATNAQVIAGDAPYSGDIVIPATVTTTDGTFTVSSIGREAFAGATIGSVSLPESVGTIESKAFCGSTLSSIELPQKLTTLKDSVFAGCSRLTDISLDLPELAEIPAGAFAGTAITTVNFSPSLKNVMNGAFRNCSALTEVTIPATLQQLTTESFAGCDAIERVTLYSTTPLVIGADVWAGATTANATLIVPEGFEDLYAAATGWKEFAHIQTHRLEVKVGDRFLYNGVPLRITSLDPATASVTYNHFDGAFRETAVQTANGKLSGDLIVPAQATYMGRTFDITSIDPYSFFYASKVTSITLPDCLGGVAPHLFEGCSKATRIVLPAGTGSIPESLFSGCSQLSDIVNLPSAVDTIGDYAFNQCSKLTQIPVIADGVKMIGRQAFFNSGLAELTIPASVDSIGYQAFANTKITTVELPSTVTKLGSQIFYQCRSLATAKLAAGFTEVPSNLFYNCSNLTSVEIPEGVERIGDYAFAGCSKLKASIPSTVTTLGKRAFGSNTALTEITLPQGLRVIGDEAFYNCKLTSIDIPAAVDSIGRQAFYGAAITEVAYPANVTRTGGYTFASCASLVKATFPDNLAAIPDGLFSGCAKLADISLPDGCLSIGKEAFKGCKLLNIEIPAQLTAVGENAFNGCTALSRADMPAAITTVPKGLFSGCTALANVTFAPGTTMIDQDAFYGCKALATIDLPATLDSIAPRVFYNCSALTRITIPDGITTVPASLFYGCTSLNEVNLPASVTTVANEAFRGCTSLTALTLPTGVTTLGTGIFYGCSKLESFDFPANIAEVPSRMFYDCKAMTHIDLPATVKTIGSSAFSGCNNLHIELGEGIEEVADYAFQKCSALNSLTIPSTLRKIGGSAYQDCTGLPEAIEIPATVSSLGGAVIQGTNVKTVYVCDPAATAAFDYTFRTVSSWSNPVFCDVVVPYGHSAAAASLTGYAKAASVTEPALDTVAFEGCTAAPDKETAAIAADLTASFAGSHSDSFAEACRKGFDANARVEIVYQLVETYEPDARAEAPAISAESELTAAATAVDGARGHFVAALTDLTPRSLYTYRWRIHSADRVIESEPMQFTTLDINNGIELTAPDAELPVDIYTLTGIYLGCFDRMADVRMSGIFLAVQSGKSFKISIR